MDFQLHFTQDDSKRHAAVRVFERKRNCDVRNNTPKHPQTPEKWTEI